MILCMTTDDIGIVNDAYKGYDQTVFGIPYCYLPRHDYRGLAADDENLFISAHGDTDDDEIGNEHGQPAYTAQKLRAVLNSYVLQQGYQGKIYISACGSAPNYINSLLNVMGAAYQGRIFGMFGDVEYAIAAPNSGQWVAAK